MMRCILAGILVAVMISVVPIWAANYSVGVEVGDWIKYHVYGTIPGLEEYDWVEMEVQSLSGTEITILATIHYKGGGEETNTINWDVETGSQPWIIPADLSKGDTFRLGYISWIINDTVTRTYAGRSRSVNLLSVSEYDIDTEMVTYWDQTSGVLVELFLNRSSPTESWTGGYTAIETNIWSPTLQATAELSSDTTTQGERVTILTVVKDGAEYPIEGATVSARIDDKIVSLSNLGGGNYEGILETADLPVGTYSIIIAVEKAGYESTQTSQNLTVEAAPETPWMLYGGVAVVIAVVAVALYLIRKRF